MRAGSPSGASAASLDYGETEETNVAPVRRGAARREHWPAGCGGGDKTYVRW